MKQSKPEQAGKQVRAGVPQAAATAPHSEAAAVVDNRQVAIAQRQLAGRISRMAVNWNQNAAFVDNRHVAIAQRRFADRVAQAAGTQPQGMIVADAEKTAPGQLTQTAFLAQLRAAVTATASAVLGKGWSAASCPDIQKLFSHHAALEPAACETIMRRYSGLATASSAADYIAPICARIGGTIQRWGDGADLSWDVGGSGLPAALEGGDAAPAPAQGPKGPQVQLKRNGDAAATADAGVTLDDLGHGASLDSGTAARLGAAFGGERFNDVRIHTGSVAAQRTRELGADAMAVGSHVAFAAGEYRPGTPSGDGLIAHELAHVIQQRGSGPLVQRQVAGVEPGESPQEHDADRVAAAVVGRLHPGDGGVADGGVPLRPSLRTGLGVRRGNRP